MDYVVGSVAALISGNVTPNRPRLIRRALTPTKHQPSPNVTPKSEIVDDRSIFLSPTLQKKKALVKKSPKRIFQTPDFDVTEEEGGITKLISPKADKVKKHLKSDLDSDMVNFSKPSGAHYNDNNKKDEMKSPKKKSKLSNDGDYTSIQINNESTPKKKKKQIVHTESVKNDDLENTEGNILSPKKRKHQKSLTKSTDPVDVEDTKQDEEPEETKKDKSPKKKRKGSTSETQNLLQNEEYETPDESANKQHVAKNKRKRKSKSKKNKKVGEVTTATGVLSNLETKTKKKKKNHTVNPNAITNKDSDSEHDSDNEIESETELANNEILDTGPVEESSDEEVDQKKVRERKGDTETNEEEIKRTLFVGNVLYNNKCKKVIKQIFSQYGQIETVRIRMVPVKDARYTPKLAIIKNELHPERSTVNVYVKFREEASVEKALVENNTVLNDLHLRVTRSDTSGAVHDPRCAVFVGNLPFAAEDEALRAKFEQCGKIESVKVIRDKQTTAGKGFGYVNFASKDAVELALQLSEEDLTMKNRILRVKRCTQTDGPRNKVKKGFQGKAQGFPAKDGFQGRGQGFRGRGQGFQGRGQEFLGRGQGLQGRGQGVQGRGQGHQGRGQGFQARGRGFQGRGRGFQGRGRGFQGREQGFHGRQDNVSQIEDGAQRRLMKKRQSQEADGECTPNKVPKNANETREKKAKKDFVGMTAEKRKKQKPKKGEKKKKAISEIMTK